MAEFEMPVDIIMAPALTPEEHIPTPEELFAAHVEAVRETGDAFDERTDLKMPSALLLGSALASGAAIISTEHFNGMDLAKGLAASAVAACVGGYTLSAVVTSRAKERAKAKYNIETQRENDAVYELYRTSRREDGTYNVAMHWLGNIHSDKGNTADEELARIAELAKTNDISEVVIHSQLVSDYYMYLRDDHDTSIGDWIKNTRGWSLVDH
jgi:hypothetical protein